MKTHKSRRKPYNERVPQSNGIPERFEQVLELPVGSLSGAARIELSGNRRAVVDGCLGIIEYSDSIIRLNTGSGLVRFTGRDLSISCLTSDSAVVEGFILSLEYMS